MSFESQLKAFAEKTHKNANAIVKKIVIEVGTSLVMKTPVGDADYWQNPAPKGYVGGRARGNWQFALGAPAITEFNRIDKTGAATIGGITQGLPADALGKIHYITNTLPYIQRLEEGWSKRQAPRGMVRLTVTEFEQVVAAAARAVS